MEPFKKILKPHIFLSIDLKNRKSTRNSSPISSAIHSGTISHEGSSVATSPLQGCSSYETTHLPRVTFSLCHQATGPTAPELSSTIGKVAKSNISSCFENWLEVPIEMKERVWEIVSSMFEVLLHNKAWVLKRANSHWRDWKLKLRVKYYDKYRTDVERQQNPGVEITRTQMWLATHTPKE